MPTETLLLVIVAAYALGVLSALEGILVRHRRASSPKDYPPKPHPRAQRFKGSWRTDTLIWPDPPTKGPSGPAPRPPTNPTPPLPAVTDCPPTPPVAPPRVARDGCPQAWGMSG